MTAVVKRRRRHRVQLLTRSQLDGRSNVARMFDGLVADIRADLGGPGRLSTIELQLIEAFAGCAVVVQHLNAKLLSFDEDDDIDLAAHTAATSAMVRIASKLGLRRRARDVTAVPTPDEYFRQAREAAE
jgi:hypothetical protein